MESLQKQVVQICRLADNSISNPEVPPIKAARSIGLSAAVIGFVEGTGILAASLSLLSPIPWMLYFLWKTSDAKKK